MERVNLIIERIVVDSTNAKVLVICPTSKYNAKGAYKMTNKLFSNIANQLGLKPETLIRNAKGGKLSFNAEFCKAGTQWVNEDTGETGVYGAKNNGKDSWKNTSYEIELSQKALFMIEAAASFGSSIDANAFFGTQVVDPTEEEKKETEEAQAEAVVIAQTA